jgi:hypothetical protein
MWRAAVPTPSVGDHLDISSPRLFTILLLNKFSDHTVVIVNPDNKDLDKTKLLCLRADFPKM